MPTSGICKLKYQPKLDHSLEGILEEASRGVEITFRYKRRYCVIYLDDEGFSMGRGDGKSAYNAPTLQELVETPLLDGKTFVEALANGEVRRELF